jgi:hypothetical protein
VHLVSVPSLLFEFDFIQIAFDLSVKLNSLFEVELVPVELLEGLLLALAGTPSGSGWLVIYSKLRFHFRMPSVLVLYQSLYNFRGLSNNTFLRADVPQYLTTIKALLCLGTTRLMNSGHLLKSGSNTVHNFAAFHILDVYK